MQLARFKVLSLLNFYELGWLPNANLEICQSFKRYVRYYNIQSLKKVITLHWCLFDHFQKVTSKENDKYSENAIKKTI